jgi:4-amino-4-deoxy-L-arabinose transferase-like glycosyltransferase
MVYRACFLAIGAVACAILFGHLGLLPLWGSEGRWGLVSRSMFQSGDLLRPLMGNAPYWDKPLFSYWQILPPAYIVGEVNELAIRLPSAIWALGLLILAHDLARLWLGTPAALISSAVLATSCGFVFWGRNAQVEMTNAAVILLILWFFFTRRSKPALVYAMAVLMGIGANMKGLPAVGVPAFCILACSLVDRDWGWLPGPGTLVTAALLFSVVFLAVPLAGCLHSSSWDPLALMWKENVVRFFAPFDHRGPFYLYFYRIFDLGAPWTLFLPPALAHIHRAGLWRDKGIRNALTVFGAIFLFFTLSGSRRSYYLLPILPFASMISGDFLFRYISRGLPGAMDILTKGTGLLMALLFTLPPAILLLKPRILPFGASDILPWVLILPVFGVLMAWGFLHRSIAGMTLPAAAVWVLYVFVFLPWQAALPDGIRAETARINAVNRPVAFLFSSETRVIFYLDRPYTVLPNLTLARLWAQETDGILIAERDIRDPSWVSFIDDRDLKAYILKKPP